MSYTLDLSNLVQSVAANISHLVTHGLAQPIFDLKHSGGMLLYVLLALAVGFVFGRWCTGLVRHRFAFQNHGEATVSGAVLADFNSPKYHLMNHVTLRMPDGTTQVDHILVSTFGVFVIETKNYSGWIFADATELPARHRSTQSSGFFAGQPHQIGGCFHRRWTVQDRNS
jgi:hypothetical protein